MEAWLESSGTGALAGRDLPAAEMIAADQCVDARARWLKSRGAAGTLEQLRARVFTAVLAGRAIETLLPGPAAPAQSGPNVPGVPDGLGVPEASESPLALAPPVAPALSVASALRVSGCPAVATPGPGCLGQ